jgi:hypothetical protein
MPSESRTTTSLFSYCDFWTAYGDPLVHPNNKISINFPFVSSCPFFTLATSAFGSHLDHPSSVLTSGLFSLVMGGILT